MIPTLRDPASQEAFARDGYVVIPFLTPTDLDHFRAVFRRLYPVRRRDFESSALNGTDDPHHLEVHREVVPWFRARVEALFVDHFLVNGFFTCKRGGLPAENESEVVLHQDWTYVDEPAVRGPLVWCPLVDVDRENGCLEVVPGSHLFVDAPRGANIPWAFREVESQLRGHLRPLPLPAGQVVVYDSALVHASAPNRTSADRPVIGLGLAPRGERLIHVYSPDGAHADVHQVEPEFYVHHVLGSRPDRWIRATDRIDVDDPVLSDDDLAALLAGRPDVPGGASGR